MMSLSVMWCEDHVQNFSILQRIHLSNLNLWTYYYTMYIQSAMFDAPSVQLYLVLSQLNYLCIQKSYRTDGRTLASKLL